MVIIPTFIFLLGIMVGSFLNVVILRLNTGRGVGGRSYCFSCGKQLEWFELIPLLSHFFLAGRCRGCHSRISFQYPLVELITGLIFLYFFKDLYVDTPTLFSLSSLLYQWVIWSILLVIFVYDLRHQIVPNGFVYAFIGLGFVRLLIFCGPSPCLSPSFIHTVISGGILFLFFFTLWFISQGRWIGFGDAKLALGIGFYLGLSIGLSALALAFWIGATVSVSILIVQKIRKKFLSQGLSLGIETLTMKSAIPFAPFLIIGTFLAEVFQSDIFHIYNILY